MKNTEIENLETGKSSVAEIEFAPGLPEVKKQYKSIVSYPFRRFPDWMIFNGAIAILSGNTLKVFVVLLAHTHNVTYCGSLSNKRLAQLTGLSQKHLYKYINELIRFGFLTNIKTGWIRDYRLNLEPRTSVKPVTRQEG